MKKTTILLLTLTLLAPLFCYLFFTEAEVFAKTSFSAEEEEIVENTIVTDKFNKRYSEWQTAGIKENHDFYLAVFPNEFKGENLIFSDKDNPNGYKPLIWDDKTSFSIFVDISETALYQITIEYYSLTDDIRPIEISVLVDGVRQYYESGQINLETFWETTHDFSVDRYGNDILPSSDQLRMWQTTRLEEVQNLYENGLLFKLEAGVNEITFNKTRGELLVGKIVVKGVEEPISYQDYLDEDNFKGTYISEYEGEHLSYKNSPAIQLGNNRSSKVTPFALVERKLNILEGSTYSTPGQAVYYEIEVPHDGYYQITLKYLQNHNQDVIVYRTLLIDGVIPFKEARAIPFRYTRKWQNQALSSLEGEAYFFKLTKGKHIIALEATEYEKRDLYYDVNDVLLGLNDLVLEINKLTGRNIDPNRDWEITDFLPNLKSDLLKYANILEETLLQWQKINKTTKNTLISSSLNQAANKLKELAKKPNEIPTKIGQISGNSGSIIESLGIILPNILSSPLSIDKFYVHEANAKIPKANDNIFKIVWVNIKRFFMSFFVDDGVSKKTPDTLEVWVARSRQYVDLMQRKVDESFTPEQGIKVNISMMPSQDKLILANSAGNQPDVAMGIDAWRPYEFAIRNAALDLREFSDFSEVASRFARGSFLQLIYDEGVFALPDTQNFQLLFYRKDIMENLGLPIPDTWEEVIAVLPELQRYGMNFYVNLASSGSFKGFGATMPFIYQYGGKIYSNDAFSAGFDDPKSIEAITFMTELFTVYALPIEVGSFYNSFRDGKLPIGIGDFGMYVQLIHAAPEIAGLWEIAPMPGVLKDGVIDRSFVGAATSNMIFKASNHQEEAWEFLKWWSSTEIQIEYAEQLIATMGPSYMWNTANKEAFKQYSWDENDKEVIVSQWDYAYDVPKIPGSYMLEREISNIWNKTVYQGENVRTAIEDALIVVNKEITRKMIEFGYLDKNGNVLNPYLLPTIETIGWWIDGND